LARAVKVLAVNAAVRRGFERVLTANDAGNTAMLTVNRQLGFQQVGQYVWFDLER
jgi:hypothetical protein